MRLLTCLLLSALVACASTQTPRAKEPKWPARPLSKEAAVSFERLTVPQMGGVATIDLDGLRARGVISADFAMDDLIDTVSWGLAMVVGDDKMKEKELDAFAGALVWMGVLKRWDAWPSVQRLGIRYEVIPHLTEAPTHDFVLLYATDSSAAHNRELIEGFAAIERASGLGFASMKDGSLCALVPDSTFELCMTAGDGWMIAGTPSGIAAHQARKEMVPASPHLLAVDARMLGAGAGTITVSGQTDLDLAVKAELADPRQAQQAEQAVTALLAQWDLRQERARKVVAPRLQALQTVVDADQAAPARLKTATHALTVEELVSTPLTTRFRQSVNMTREGGRIDARATLPAEAIDRLARMETGSITAMYLLGIGGAVAIPNFIKYQCRSRQAEAKAHLKALALAQLVYRDETGRWGDSMEAIGFVPESGRRYTYCLGKQCIPCDEAGCLELAEDENPCLGPEVGEDYAEWTGCAVGHVDGNGGGPDVWIVTSDYQEPLNLFNDCL